MEGLFGSPLNFQAIGYEFSKDEMSLQSGTTVSSVTCSKAGHFTRGEIPGLSGQVPALL